MRARPLPGADLRLAFLLCAVFASTPSLARAQGLSQSPQPPTPSTSTCPVVLPTPNVVGRIVGGTPATPATASFMAALFTGSGSFFCSGSVLSSTWVLTAAHCVHNRSATEISVRLGGTQARLGRGFSVLQIYIPDEWLADSNSRRHDIALLKLSEPASGYTFAALNANDTVPLPESFNRAVGYGVKEFLGPFDGELYKVDLPTLALETCKEEYIWWVDEGIICTLYPNRHDCSACHGDSGGPLLQYDVNGSPVVVGVASFGVFCNGKDFPGGFVRVSPHIAWMRRVGAEFDTSMTATQVFSASAMAHSPTATPSLCPTVIPNSPPSRKSLPFDDTPVLRLGSPAAMGIARLMVAIFHGRFLCTGVLISRTWVLITATCDVETTSSFYIGGRNIITGYRASAKKVYRGRQLGSIGNVTLVELDDDTVNTSATALVSANSKLPSTGSFARVLVYDIFNNVSSSGYDGTLRQFDVAFAPLKRCRKRNTKAFLCTSELEAGCAPCAWDEGAPLFQFTSEGRPVLVGILHRETSCYDDIPGSLFLKVSRFLPWIRSTGAAFTEIRLSTTDVPSIRPSPSATPTQSLASAIPVASKVPAAPSPESGLKPGSQVAAEDDEGTNVVIVVPSVIGGVVVVVVVALVIVFAVRRRSASIDSEVPVNL